MLELIAFLYSQLINIFESLIWHRGLWKLEYPFPRYKEEPKQDAYHVFLVVIYALPFIQYEPTRILYATWIVWTLNDLLWNIWAVKPRDWIKWYKFYFNPRDAETVWIARLLICKVDVTPRRMFYLTLFRLTLLPLLVYFSYFPLR